MGRLATLVSLGVSDALPDRLARHVRIANVLSMIAFALVLTGMPLDALGGGLNVVLLDLIGLCGFVSCLVLNARGRHTAARVLLALFGNSTMFGGVLQTGTVPEFRVVFVPLVILPFLLFAVSERGWLVVFAVIPVVEYFVTRAVAHDAPSGIATDVFLLYGPILAFTMTIAGAFVFAYVQQGADDKLRQAQARAAEGSRLVALGEMSSGIAHEIRNPLAAIHLAASQIAAHPDQPALIAPLAERIQRIVMRASRIIDALRSFARDASGDPFVATPVERILSDSLELCAKRFGDHGIELVVGEVSPAVVVECRSVQLAQVLVNLLGNAFDAVSSIERERWVRVDTRIDGAHLELAVSDSGPGIPAGSHLRIFEPFYTTKAPDRGTGIGLSLSRDLVAAHRGTLELDAAAPHTRFVIRLPLVQARAPRAPSSLPA